MQTAANQLTSGVRVPARIVPAVTDVSHRQAREPNSLSAPVFREGERRDLNP